MTADPKGRGLFIVDNSVSGWTGLRYLEEWSGIAKAFDIATGLCLLFNSSAGHQLATSLEGRDESANKRRNHVDVVLADLRLIKFGARG